MNLLRGRSALLLAASAALPLLLVILAAGRFSREVVEASGETALSARVEQAVRKLADDDAQWQRRADWIARVPALRTSEVLQSMIDKTSSLQRITILDRAGRAQVSSDPGTPLAVDSTGALAELIARGKADSRVEAGQVRYVAPILENGALAGAVLLEAPLEAFTAPLLAASARGTDMTLLDSSGRELWSSREGVSVSASSLRLPVAGTPFSLAAMEREELPHRVRIALTEAIAAGLVVVLIAFVLQVLAVRNSMRPLRQLTQAASAVAKGDYAARLPLDGRSDQDTLALSFNAMAETLAVSRAGLEDKVRERTQALEAVNVEMSRRHRELAERGEELARHRYREQAKGRALAALTADAELDQVVGAALGELAGPVGAAVMICYQLDGQQLTPVATYAASEGARTTSIPLAGIAEQALRTGRIETVEDLPAGLDLRFDCLVAAGIPRAVLLVPLTVGRRPSGLLVVGALGPLSPEALTTISDLAAPLALTMARRTLLDHTERIARELARRNEELREQATALEEQGVELKEQQRELELKNREVEKADRLKSEFLANMSHELRTPLNAVIGFSDLLYEDAHQLTATQREWVRDIQESGKHLLMLINRVLDLAKIEAGRMTFHYEPISAAEAVASACTLVRPTAQKKGIPIAIVESEVPLLRADRGLLHQVLLNLLSNAVKFSPEKAPIEVGFSLLGESVQIWVKDHGPGIDDESQRRLFEPFFQAESPLVKKHEGTGLGLAISRRLVEQQGGSMGVTSKLGEGSTFFFTLPISADEEVLPANDAVPGTSDTDTGSAGRSVLVVDDHDMNLSLARELLERRGCNVILAHDGEEGLQLALANSPELILLDLAMPRKDGFALARELRADARTAGIPLVALTALAMRGDDERVLSAGFDGYLPKPLERRALDATLARFFRREVAA